MTFRNKPPGCAGCPYEHKGRSYVPGCGPETAAVAIIGQAPGENEAHTGIPFFEAPGRSGARLTRWLNRAGLARQTFYIDNAVRCWIRVGKLDAERDVVPPQALAECWRRHLWPQLDKMLSQGTLKYIVAVGIPAARQLIRPSITHQDAGGFFEVRAEQIKPSELREGGIPF